jgi:hypothetical protein
MALNSTTFALPKSGEARTKRRKDDLLKRHREAVEKVLADAKTFSDDRKRDLEKIGDEKLRRSATR